VLVHEESAAPSLNEMGSVRAQRHRVPTVMLEATAGGAELACLEASTTVAMRRVEAACAAAVERHLPV
jgi:hypothetical protein